VRKAVHDSLDQEGSVIIHNRMDTEQTINVNQKNHRIPSGETLTLKVPVGTLTARLPGQALTNWTITAPTYKQRIDIVPDTQQTVTTYRPIESTVPVTTYRPVDTVVPVTTYRTLYSASPTYVPTVDTYYVNPVTVYRYYWPY
jgi:hypothetical protein